MLGGRATPASLVAGWLILCSCSSGPPVAEKPEEPIVAAAASLRRVIPPILDAYRSATGAPIIRVSYGASGLLRQQVEAGAPIDAVVFAAESMVDRLIREGLVDESSRKLVAENLLVLVGRPGKAGGDQPAASSLNFRDLGRLPESSKLAIGDPSMVPAGQYAREALKQLEVWAGIHEQLVYGGDVTRVLTYARRGEVDAAVVYATDARGVDELAVLDQANWSGAPRPKVVAAVTSLGMGNEVVTGFINFLESPAARSVFLEHGFTVP